MFVRRILPAGLLVISALGCSSSIQTSRSPEPAGRSAAPTPVGRQSTAARLGIPPGHLFRRKEGAASGYQVRLRGASAPPRAAKRLNDMRRRGAGSCIGLPATRSWFMCGSWMTGGAAPLCESGSMKWRMGDLCARRIHRLGRRREGPRGTAGGDSPRLRSATDRVLELVGMLAALDDDRHPAGQTGQLIRP